MRDYFVDERFEAGIQLLGTEVKSIRGGKAQISDVFGRVERDEVWLHNAHIEQYAFGSTSTTTMPAGSANFCCTSTRSGRSRRRSNVAGHALIPLRMYFKEALVKVEVALCTGKKHFDKRDDLKKKAEMREVTKALKFRR